MEVKLIFSSLHETFSLSQEKEVQLPNGLLSMSSLPRETKITNSGENLNSLKSHKRWEKSLFSGGNAQLVTDLLGVCF